MEIKLTEHELSVLRMIISRYGNELEMHIKNNSYPEKYAGIALDDIVDTIGSLYRKICSLEWEVYEAGHEVRLKAYIEEYLEEEKRRINDAKSMDD